MVLRRKNKQQHDDNYAVYNLLEAVSKHKTSIYFCRHRLVAVAGPASCLHSFECIIIRALLNRSSQ